MTAHIGLTIKRNELFLKPIQNTIIKELQVAEDEHVHDNETI